jgi:hypothetical protein
MLHQWVHTWYRAGLYLTTYMMLVVEVEGSPKCLGMMLDSRRGFVSMGIKTLGNRKLGSKYVSQIEQQNMQCVPARQESHVGYTTILECAKCVCTSKVVWQLVGDHIPHILSSRRGSTPVGLAEHRTCSKHIKW